MSEIEATHPRNYFENLYLPQFVLHKGIGPSFSVVLIGAAIAKQVQATATTRTKVLTARVMFFLHCGSPGSGNPCGRIIPALSRAAEQARRQR
jgi:hypothetical protein